MKIKKLSIISILLISPLLLVACGTKSSSQDSTNTSSNSSQNASIKASLGGDLATLDSAKYSDVISSDIIGSTSEGLYRTTKNNEPLLGLAASKPKITDQGKVYTFTLRKAKWSDGTPVTADDFVYSFQKVVDPKTASQSADQFDIFLNGTSIRKGEKPVTDLGVKALSSDKLQITLTAAAPYLPQLLTGTPFIPQSKAFAEKYGDKYGTSSSTYLGNGPFIIKGWNGNSTSYTLEKNKNYWDQKNVKLDKITFNVIKDASTGVNLFQDKSLDYTTLVAPFTKQQQGNPDNHTVTKAKVNSITPNMLRKIPNNLNVRLAIGQAIDKKSLVNSILSDGSKELNGWIPANFAKGPNGQDFRKENGDLMSYNVKKAQSAWTKAKKVLGMDKITLELLSADTKEAKSVTEYIQGQLQKNLPGLTIELKSVPLSNRLQLQRQGNYDFVFASWTPDYADPLNFFQNYVSKGGLNFVGFTSKEYDDDVNEIRTTLANDPKARWKKMLETEKLFIQKDAGLLPLYQSGVSYLQSDKLKGLEILPFGREFSYREAYLEK